MQARFLTLVGMIVAAAVARLLPHPWNFTPVTAMALFGGAHFARRRDAFLVPLAGLFASDLAIGLMRLHGRDFGVFYGWEQAVVYATFLAIVGIGILIRSHRQPLVIGAAALGSASLFFLTTNFGTWAFGTLYPKTVAGLVQCYVAGIPFYQGTFLGDLCYTAAFFGGFAVAEQYVKGLRESPVLVAAR